jgi:hypothetical protein
MDKEAIPPIIIPKRKIKILKKRKDVKGGLEEGSKLSTILVNIRKGMLIFTTKKVKNLNVSSPKIFFL